MKFYYNPNLNICAEELWVLDFLVIDCKIRDVEEGQEWLKTHEDIFGWHKCTVSATIEEAMRY